jgi:Arc/MetJ family transcription regulator
MARGDRLVRFLLGELGPEEQEGLEAEFFARDDAFEELLAAEDDLIDAYAGGALTGDRRVRFEARYLGTREGQERVEFSRALRRLAGRRPSSRAWMPLAASLAAVVLLAGALVYSLAQGTRSELAQVRSQREALERRIAEQEARAAEQGRRLDLLGEDLARVRSDRDRLAELLGAPDTPVRVASFTLSAGLLRDPSAGHRVAVPTGGPLVGGGRLPRVPRDHRDPGRPASVGRPGAAPPDHAPRTGGHAPRPRRPDPAGRLRPRVERDHPGRPLRARRGVRAPGRPAPLNAVESPGRSRPGLGDGLSCISATHRICMKRQIMRTTLDLDDQALANAMRVSEGKTKTRVINEALREYARRRRLRGLLKFRGRLRWEGSLDDLRQREARRR